uniref:Lipocln_cytosolic_FA-bd_dom domain-containing protein n=1 Tax=Syphacia muris TaxID=451379 RepID=A0A0N5AKV3_9BILA
MKIRRMPIALISSLILIAYSKKLPDIFLGTYTLEYTKNLSEYLIAKEYRWLARSLILATPVTRVIHKAESGLPLRYDIDTLTWKKNIRFRDVVLGEEFESQHLEDGLFKIKYDYNNNTLTEALVGIDCNPSYNETFRYTRENNYLVMRTEWKGVKAEAYYKKQARA